MAAPVAPSTAPIPLLRTKLFVPPAQQHLVVRPQLLQRMDAGRERRLTLVSAPAGFGKTTTVRAWLAQGERPIAWLSLDAGDNDPVRFLTYLVAALQTVAPSVGAGSRGALESQQPHLSEAILTALLNDLSALPTPIVLVLDDFHLIDAAPVDHAVAFLLEHLPPQLHIVITTRQDPPLPLSRLRARGQMTDVRASDLRFSRAETASYLNDVMGLGLAASDIAALEARTEGWIAGLQLAVLSLQGQHDASAFIHAFAGDHRYVADYLVDEVLQRQPAETRAFLLQTAILDRLHGALCDAVTEQTGGAARLEALARGNVFVIPLDDQRRWYRYHHLFADVLRAHLQAEHPTLVPTLHLRASRWYQQQGLASDAIRHALAADDPEYAADLIEAALPELRRGRLGATLRGWLRTMPEAVLSERPVLSVAYAWALMTTGELGGVRQHLDAAERWISTGTDTDTATHTPSGATTADAARDAEFRRLPGVIAAYRASLALLQGDAAQARTYAQQALAHTPADEHLTRGSAEALLGLALWPFDDLDGALRHFAAGMVSLDQAGMLPDVINGATNLAAMQIARGHLREAKRILEQALQRASEQPAPQALGIADFHVGLSEIALAQHDLPSAEAHLQRSQQLVDDLGAWRDHRRWYVAMAQVRHAQAPGDAESALALLDDAERQHGVSFVPDLRPIPAQRARIQLAGGALDAAQTWAHAQGLRLAADVDYLHEYEQLTLAHLRLAEQRRSASPASVPELAPCLARLLEAAETAGRIGSCVEILIAQALAAQQAGDLPGAQAALEHALRLAEPEGYASPFIDAGAPLAQLLHTGAERLQQIAPQLTRLLLTAAGAPATASAAPVEQPGSADLREPLSARELDVLRLLATELSGPEIADELSVSLNTLRTHTKNIYGKLGVNTRRAAVRRAEELALFPHARTSGPPRS